jgi:hypothetical protein
MKSLDNTGSSNKGRNHFIIEINGISFAYCYIRKNACSAFKDLFMHESVHPMDKRSALANMISYHSCNLEQVALADFRIVILRDPISRVASVFQNKFAQQLGFSDIFKNYNKITGLNPRLATFNDFIFNYLDNEILSLDVHLHPQISHLYPIIYNASCEIKSLYNMADNIFGSTVADKYFKVERNKSSTFLPSSSKFLNYPAYILNDLYLKTGRVPNFLEIMNSECIEFLKSKYFDDIRLYRDFTQGSSGKLSKMLPPTEN